MCTTKHIKKGKYLWRYICAVTYMQPKKLAGFFMNLEGEKLICRSAMHACMHLDVQAKELAR